MRLWLRKRNQVPFPKINKVGDWYWKSGRQCICTRLTRQKMAGRPDFLDIKMEVWHRPPWKKWGVIAVLSITSSAATVLAIYQ